MKFELYFLLLHMFRLKKDSENSRFFPQLIEFELVFNSTRRVPRILLRRLQPKAKSWRSFQPLGDFGDFAEK